MKPITKRLSAAAAALLLALAPAAAADVVVKRPKVDVVFVLDTTGSMAGLINAAKEKIWSIASTLADTDPAPEIRIGLVGYRDRGDEYITRRTDLTLDLDRVYTELMKFQAGGGGDMEESVNQALHEAVTLFSWSDDPEAYRVIFLVGDAPPHLDYQDDVHYAASVSNALKRGIVINTVQCGQIGVTAKIWREIAGSGEGVYARVEQSGGALLAATPYDARLAELADELDGTRLGYGSRTEQIAQAEKFAMAKEISSGASLAARARRSEHNATAAGKANFLGTKELVADVASGEVSLGDLREDELPAELRGLDKDSAAKVVGEKQERRQAIEKEIGALSKKRQEFLAEQAKKQTSASPVLDEVIYSAIAKQAAARGITYDSGPKY